MPASAEAYLRHILAESLYLMDRTAQIENDDFLGDQTLTRAVVRSLEVIGEAARQVPVEFKEKHSEVQWREMIGMRDRLIHGYFSVDYEIVWDVVTNKIPDVRRQLERIIADEFGDREL